MTDCDTLRAAIERCWREIAVIEAPILAGHPDPRGLCLALADWSGELRLLQEANEATETPHLAPVCADLPEVGHVTPLDAGGRDVGAAWRDPDLWGASRLPTQPHGPGVGSRQMSADVLR